MLFSWLLEPDEELASEPAARGALATLLGFTLEEQDLVQFGTRLRRQDSFAAYRQQLLARWRDKTDSDGIMEETDAHGFVVDFIGNMDHAIFFEQGITASVTYTRRGALNDTDMQFPGSMPCWTLHLTTRGQGLFLNDHMEAEPTRGDLMLFHPDAGYHYGLHPGADDWEHLWVLFQPRPNWESWLEWPSCDKGISLLTLQDELATAQVEKLFRDLIALRSEQTSYRNDLEHNRLEELLIRCRQFATVTVDRERDQRVRRACDYMQQHLTQGFSIDDVATACNLSPSRLAHLFKEHMGVSPKSWSNNMRLQQARKLLLASSDPIAVIAAQVGYEDPTQFSKYFSKNVGCSPREFRRSFRENS